MNIALLSSNYNVRRLNIADVQDIYSLCISIVHHLSRNIVFLMI